MVEDPGAAVQANDDPDHSAITAINFGGLPFFLLADAWPVSRRTEPGDRRPAWASVERLTIVMEVMFAGSAKVERKFALDVVEACAA